MALDLENKPPSPSAQYARFFYRIVAYFLDAIVLVPLTGLIAYNAVEAKIMVLHLLLVALVGIYKPWMEYTYGWTLGKKWVGLKIVNLNLGAITRDQAIIRNIPFIVGHLITFITTFYLYQNEQFLAVTNLEEYLTFVQTSDWQNYGVLSTWLVVIAITPIAFDPRKQGLHDRLAQTLVVE